MPLRSDTAPTAADIEAIALDVVEKLPDFFRDHARDVVLRVEDFAPKDILTDLEIEDPFELTGLYAGIPMTEKLTSEQSLQPDVVWLFRRAILDEWIARQDVSLSNLVAHVTVHEFAHHFGWSDEDIASVDTWWT